MAGAMAGSAVLAFPPESSTLHTVTVTVNNDCNLQCPHCYLQYNGTSGLIAPHIVDAIFASGTKQICIVGKEPLASSRVVSVTQDILFRASESGRVSSIVTNGLNLNLLSYEAIDAITWIDVSIDAGRAGYKAYRGGSMAKLVRNLKRVSAYAPRKLRIVNTLSRQNVSQLAEMITLGKEVGAERIVFSPFQSTDSSGPQTTTMLTPAQYLDAVTFFIDDTSVLFTMDAKYLANFMLPESVSAFAEYCIAACRFPDRLLIAVRDPIGQGVLRLSYDGLVMTPFESIDTSNYRHAMRFGRGTTLDDAFAQLLARSNHEPASV